MHNILNKIIWNEDIELFYTVTNAVIQENNIITYYRYVLIRWRRMFGTTNSNCLTILVVNIVCI